MEGLSGWMITKHRYVVRCIQKKKNKREEAEGIEPHIFEVVTGGQPTCSVPYSTLEDALAKLKKQCRKYHTMSGDRYCNGGVTAECNVELNEDNFTYSMPCKGPKNGPDPWMDYNIIKSTFYAHGHIQRFSTRYTYAPRTGKIVAVNTNVLFNPVGTCIVYETDA